jgi:hypothetical protein
MVHMSLTYWDVADALRAHSDAPWIARFFERYVDFGRAIGL